MKDWKGEVIGVVIVVALLAGVVAGIYSVMPETIEDHAHGCGDLVTAKLDGRTGMIVAVFDFRYAYRVRFSCAEQVTNTRILSDDGAIENSPYAVVTMSEYELTAAKGGE